MQTVELAVEARTGTGKGVARKLRDTGRVPAVLYGPETEGQSISLLVADFVACMEGELGRNTIFTLKGKGDFDGKLAMAKAVQKSPVYRELLHVDLYQIGEGSALEIEVPVHLLGEPVGVKLGGILFQNRRHLTIRCSISNLPSRIEVDVSDLDIGHRKLVSELELEEGLELVHRNEFAICVVKPPRGVEEAESTEDDEAEDGEGEATEDAATEEKE